MSIFLGVGVVVGATNSKNYGRQEGTLPVPLRPGDKRRGVTAVSLGGKGVGKLDVWCTDSLRYKKYLFGLADATYIPFVPAVM